MEYFHLFLAGLTAIILFVFGIENFSREIESLSGERFREGLASATRHPVMGVTIGALVTMMIQSSSATSVISISLVNAGVLSFRSSVGIIFGSNIGTTMTAQLVAFKLTQFAPFFIVIGFLMTILRNRASIFGKAVFYFGFVFFSLNLISSTLAPLQENEALLAVLKEPQNPLYAILFGCIFTALVQSSSVTTGLAIIFTQQGLIGLENAVPLILGANIGTTATALIAVFNMDTAAKKTAFSHFLFNVGGVLLFLPLLFMFDHKLADYSDNPAIALATIHLIFNVTASVVFTVFINPFTRFVDYVMGEGKMEFERIQLPEVNTDDTFESVSHKLNQSAYPLFTFLQENYNTVTLSIEANYRSLFEVADKRLQYLDFVKKQYLHFFARSVMHIKEPNESRELIALINQFDYLFQIHDSIKDLFQTKRVMNDSFIELRSDLLILIRGLSMETLDYFNEIAHDMQAPVSRDRQKKLNEKAVALQQEINDANRNLLPFVLDPHRQDAGLMINFITYSQRLKDKLGNFAGLNIKVEQPVEEEST